MGDPQAFMLLHSGASVRKRSNWHLHVFVVQHRWQKAWVYAILALKNLALSGPSLLAAVSAPRRRQRAPASAATQSAPD